MTGSRRRVGDEGLRTIEYGSSGETSHSEVRWVCVETEGEREETELRSEWNARGISRKRVRSTKSGVYIT